MGPPSNEVYTAFSFIGFLMCVVPFYWHLEGTWEHFPGSCTGSKHTLTSHSLEYRNLPVHGLDRSWVSCSGHQLDCME